MQTSTITSSIIAQTIFTSSENKHEFNDASILSSTNYVPTNIFKTTINYPFVFKLPPTDHPIIYNVNIKLKIKIV